MRQTFGDYITIENEKGVEQLNLSFSPSSIPLKQRWRNNGLSADFLGDYVTTFFPKDEGDPATVYRQAEIQGNVSYIANELLENSMKYTATHTDAMISISIFLLDDKIVVQGTNETTESQWQILHGVITELMENDAADLFIQRMEQDALGETSSGLGLITMVNDYAAELAWQVASTADGMVVTTQVKVAI